jgi:AcrR family transcriptional regulator
MQLSVVIDQKNDQKVAEILSRLRDAFAEKGFDGASMQDLARAAGISVGNFYRYFPSKSDIIARMIAVDMAEMQGEFAAVLAAPHPLEGLRSLIHRKVTSAQMQQNGQLWAEIAAMSRRNVSVGHAACAMEDNVASNLTDIFAIETGLSREQAKQRFGAEAAFIMVLVRSVAMMSPRENSTINDLNTLILRSIDQTLDSIADSKAKQGAVGLKGL